MQLGRQTLSQAVSAAVLDRIRSGEFGPGDRLPTEKSLMQEYGVGRNSVREAVQALVTLGLVDVRPGRGATVIGIESDAVMDAETISVLLKEEAVDDLYAFRRLLEVEIASRAAVAATPRDLDGDRGEHSRVRVGARARAADQRRSTTSSTRRSPARATTRSTRPCSTRSAV